MGSCIERVVLCWIERSTSPYRYDFPGSGLPGLPYVRRDLELWRPSQPEQLSSHRNAMHGLRTYAPM